MKSKCDYRNLEEQEEQKMEIVEEKKIHVTGKEFREDIALLRALAILAVLGYHFWPKVFPLGFIGVDVFFVISGYLIMAILQRSKDRPHRVIIDFYYRRVKRIVPVYYLVLFMIGFSTMFVYTAVWAQRYFPFYFGAIFFYSNFALLRAEGDYFAEATEKLPFLHSWSLGVEMQFYLIAPFLFFLSKIDANIRLGHLILFASLLSSLYFQLNSLPIISFYHPLSRIWQFLCGMLASLYTENMKTMLTSKQSNIISIISLINASLMFLPFFHQVNPPFLLQIMVTISSTGFILFSPNCTIQWSQFSLGYIAKISYALYLIHFPALRFTEYLNQYYDSTIYVQFPALVITFLLSTIVHHFFEVPTLHSGKLKNFVQIFKYLSLCLLIGWKWAMVVHPACVHTAAIAENTKFVSSLYRLEGGHFVDDGFLRPQPPFGHYVYEGNTGKLKIVILGNSWAAQQGHLVRNHFLKQQTAEMHLFSQPSFTFGIHGTNGQVKTQIPFFMDFLQKLRPDYVFILLRYHNQDSDDLSPYTGPEDRTVETYWQGIKNIRLFAVQQNPPHFQGFSLYTKKIFIEAHQPFDCAMPKKQDFLNRFLDGLQKKEKLEKFNQPFNASSWYNSPVHQRLKIIMHRCKKCHLINVSEVFIDHKRNLVKTYDPDKLLAYLDNGCHLTASGLKMIEKSFHLAIENGIKMDTTKINATKRTKTK